MLFDAEPRAFGPYRVEAPLGPGRFGPTFTAVDPDGARVVVRTVAEPLTAAQRAALVERLEAICAAPLDHPAIAKPVGSGLEGDRPYIAHAWAPGEPLDVRLERDGVRPLEELLPWFTRVAAALDFAAAAAVHHGALTARDIIVRDDEVSLVGLGVAQAVADAGGDAPMADDVAALAGILYAATGEHPLHVARAESALGFIAAIQAQLREHPPVADEPRMILAADAPLVERDAQDHHVAAEPAAFAADTSFEMVRSDAPVAPVAAEPFASFSAEERRGGGRRLAVVAALLAGVIGFAVGYAVGQREGEGAPAGATASPAAGTSSTDAVAEPGPPPADVAKPSAPEPAPPSVSTPPARPASPTAGRQAPSTPAAPPQATPRPSVRAERAPASASPAVPAQAGQLEVLSRPEGASVFIDGRPAGATPVVVSGIASGSHAIRLELPGYQPWMTRVELPPGGRLRVGGSLDR